MAGEGKEGRVWKPGERFGLRDARARLVLDGPSAAYLNALVAELRRRNPLVGVPPVDVAEGSDGRSVSVALPRKIYAKLSGAGTGGQYSFVEQEWTGSAWADGGGNESGTNSAWESNHLAGLAGKVVLLRWEESSADWRFHWNAYGGCEAELCATVTACGAYLAGATVTVKNVAETITYGSCTTDSHGRCCVGGLSVGSYHVIGSKTGYSTVTVDASIVPCTGVAPPIDLVPTTPKQICVKVYGCPAAYRSDGSYPPNADPDYGLFYLPGATVALKRSGTTLYSGSTNASGQVCFTVADLNPYDLVVTATNYVHDTSFNWYGTPSYQNHATVSANGCTDILERVFLHPDSSHVCCNGIIPKAMTLTSSCGGGVAMNWAYSAGSIYSGPADWGWFGCQMATKTIPTCDAYGVISESSGLVAVWWTLRCVYVGGRFHGVQITQSWLDQCVITSATVYGTTWKRYFVGGNCFPTFAQVAASGAQCPTIGGFRNSAGAVVRQVTCFVNWDAIGDPFDVTCIMPAAILPGVVNDFTCPQSNIMLTPGPPVPVACPGAVTIS
jgi:hypothetical protein